MRQSSQKLYDAITEQIGTFGNSNTLQQEILTRVKQDYYNDFFGVPAMPITTLVADLRAAGLVGLAERAANGEFDATDEEAEEWRTSTEGRETLKQFRS